MLANGALFSWLFQGTVLNIWRQVLWGIGLVLLFLYIKKFFEDYKAVFCIVKDQMLFMFIVFVFALFSWVLLGFNTIRLEYAFWVYFSGVPFVLFPCILIQSGKPASEMFNMFVSLGVFLALGIITDYLLGGKITMFLGVFSKKMSLEDLNESGRYCFTAEAPTTFSVYFVFCMVCSLWKMYVSETQRTKLLMLLISMLYVVGAWFTGSRQMVAVLAGTFLVGLGYYALFISDKKRFLLTSIMILTVVFSSVAAFMYKDKAFQDRYTSSSITKDKRTLLWEKGYDLTFGSPEWGVFLWGNGVGITQGQKAEKGEALVSHFESTYFSRMLDVGFIGVIMLLYPFIRFLSRFSIHNYSDVLMFCFFLSYLFVCFVSPNGAHQTTQMVVFIALGLIANKQYFFINEGKVINDEQNEPN